MLARNSILTTLMGLGLLALTTTAARAQYDSGSDGSDGELTGPSFFDITIDLAQAATGTWSDPSPVAGRGIYDPDKWAVVFKYTTINIPNAVTVRFLPHPSNAPVIWLASGNVNIAAGATVELKGADHDFNIFYGKPGPGGFPGGTRRLTASTGGSAGFGPGAGAFASGGTYSTVGSLYSGMSQYGGIYGIANIMPLIGGSGGGGWEASTSSSGGHGGGGGGAILIASTGNIAINGTINCKGGPGRGTATTNTSTASGAGAGGAIRLIANNITGSAAGLIASGHIDAASGTGRGSGTGRISVEATSIALSGSSDPTYVPSFPDQPIFPDNYPILRATLVDGNAVPPDPTAGIDSVDVQMNNSNSVTINIAAQNVQPGTPVTVLIVPARGSPLTVTSGPLVGTFAASAASATATLPPGRSEIQLRANW